MVRKKLAYFELMKLHALRWYEKNVTHSVLVVSNSTITFMLHQCVINVPAITIAVKVMRVHLSFYDRYTS